MRPAEDCVEPDHAERAERRTDAAAAERADEREREHRDDAEMEPRGDQDVHGSGVLKLGAQIRRERPAFAPHHPG